MGRGMPAGGTLLGVGIMMAVWSRRAEVVRLFDDHFELKLAPLASLRKVRYSDIKCIEMLKKNVARLTLHEAKAIKIPLNMLQADEQQELMSFLRATGAA